MRYFKFNFDDQEVIIPESKISSLYKNEHGYFICIDGFCDPDAGLLISKKEYTKLCNDLLGE